MIVFNVMQQIFKINQDLKLLLVLWLYILL